MCQLKDWLWSVVLESQFSAGDAESWKKVSYSLQIVSCFSFEKYDSPSFFAKQ